MRIHDPIAIAKNLAAFDFQELAPFNGGSFCMYYGDQGDQSDLELHPGCSSPRAPRWSPLPTIPGSRPRKPLSRRDTRPERAFPGVIPIRRH